jgi:hypothetical protein
LRRAHGGYPWTGSWEDRHKRVVRAHVGRIVVSSHTTLKPTSVLPECINVEKLTSPDANTTEIPRAPSAMYPLQILLQGRTALRQCLLWRHNLHTSRR